MACGLGGGVLGSLTGIIPGLHVNTLALALLGFTGLLTGWLEGFAPTGEAELLLAVLVAATGLAHTFINFIPATFLGAPEGETALSVLPGHRLLLEGQGYRAVVLSAYGGLAAVAFILVLLLPLRWFIGEPLELYQRARPYMFWILAAISALLVLTERRRIPYRRVLFKGHTLQVTGSWSRWLGRCAAAAVFCLSGLLGLVTWELETTSPLDWPSSVLFPTFTGLFGLATLLMAYKQTPQIPKQQIAQVKVSARQIGRAGGLGGGAGAFVALLPGVTAGIGTVLAMLVHNRWSNRAEEGDVSQSRGSRRQSLADKGLEENEQTVLILGGVNTAAALMVLAGLFIIGRPRSGVTLAVNDLIRLELWEGSLPPQALCYLLAGVLAATLVAFPATCLLGRLFARVLPKLDYKLLLKGVIGGLTLLVYLFTGWLGLLALATATAVGLVAPLVGVRRSHAMGVLLVPIMVSFVGGG